MDNFSQRKIIEIQFVCKTTALSLEAFIFLIVSEENECGSGMQTGIAEAQQDKKT
jgi:hypothetical protein